jgi:protein involved in sex pheromone biosynthesis
MKKILIVAAATGLMSLAACNTPAANNTAENVADAMEAEADNMEMIADNATNEVVEDAAENAADNLEAAADNVAG